MNEGKKNKLFRCLLHMPVGLAVVAFVLINPIVSSLLFLGFMVYELNEDYHIKDEAYVDILGMLVGIGLAGCLWLAVKLLLV